uniref:proline-rich protein 36-like n=1 Tax=Erigeron canadensis TaxID=72917 RepID=UPI001CB8E64E|nr:proline-rich protein 36-like [Erigeron canadensis]
MATATSISPDKQLETDNRQPLITGSPPQPSPEQLVNSNSPNFINQQPENSADVQLPPLPEAVDNLLETPAPPSPLPEALDYGQLASPPETVQALEEPTPLTSLPPENLAYGQLPPPPEAVENIQETSPPPSYSPENTAYGQLPPLSESVEILQEHTAVPSSSPDKTISYSQSSPQTKIITPSSPTELPENTSSNRVSILSRQSQSPPSPPAAEEHQPENTSPNHESQLTSSPTGIEDPAESPNYGINPSSNFEPSIINDSLAIEHEEPAETPDFHITATAVKPERNAIPITHQSVKESSPSPAVSPSSPKVVVEPTIGLVTPPLGFPPLGFAASKPQISPWTHQETANLIQAYQEKWYSLKRGPLKAGQWEEVAITVAARCGYDEPTKTAKQCRHKIEKLRKRYRAERGRPRSKANEWNFFKLMDNLERGPLPISSSQGMAVVEYQKSSTSNGNKRKHEYSNDVGGAEYLGNRRSSRSRSTNHQIPNGDLTTNLRVVDGGNRVVRGLRTPMIHKPREFYQQVDDGGEEDEENNADGGDEEEAALQLAAEIKGFAEKFVKMENKKIEMMRDVERYRLEMENKRMEMILESQQMLVETVTKAFGGSHKQHKLSAN